jgi:opacity protein-like surface antigen
LAVAVALAGATTALADAGSSDDSGRPPWVGEGEPLMLEAAALGSLSVGGRFQFDDPASTRGRVTLADHGGFAITADARAAEGAQYELFYSREATALHGDTGVPRTDLTVEYVHLGGTLVLDDELMIKPYVAGGLGITRFTPDEVGNTDTRFSLSLGLGLKWPATRNLSLRVEGRGFLTLVNPDAAVFCGSGSDGLLCRVRGSGQSFLQGQFLAGIVFAF